MGLHWASSCFSSAGVAPRREVVGAAVASLAALADYQGEPARAFKKYGSALLKLEDAVNSGDLTSIRSKLRKFELFTGAFRNDPGKQDKVSLIAGKIIDAVESGDKASVKKEYASLLQVTDLKKLLVDMPIPKGSRIIDTTSSVAGTAKLVQVTEQ